MPNLKLRVRCNAVQTGCDASHPIWTRGRAYGLPDPRRRAGAAKGGQHAQEEEPAAARRREARDREGARRRRQREVDRGVDRPLPLDGRQGGEGQQGAGQPGAQGPPGGAARARLPAAAGLAGGVQRVPPAARRPVRPPEVGLPGRGRGGRERPQAPGEPVCSVK